MESGIPLYQVQFGQIDLGDCINLSCIPKKNGAGRRRREEGVLQIMWTTLEECEKQIITLRFL